MGHEGLDMGHERLDMGHEGRVGSRPPHGPSQR